MRFTNYQTVLLIVIHEINMELKCEDRKELAERLGMSYNSQLKKIMNKFTNLTPNKVYDILENLNLPKEILPALMSKIFEIYKGENVRFVSDKIFNEDDFLFNKINKFYKGLTSATTKKFFKENPTVTYTTIFKDLDNSGIIQHLTPF